MLGHIKSRDSNDTRQLPPKLQSCRLATIMLESQEEGKRKKKEKNKRQREKKIATKPNFGSGEESKKKAKKTFCWLCISFKYVDWISWETSSSMRSSRNISEEHREHLLPQHSLQKGERGEKRKAAVKKSILPVAFSSLVLCAFQTLNIIWYNRRGGFHVSLWFHREFGPQMTFGSQMTY